jgi:hypothetical protein
MPLFSSPLSICSFVVATLAERLLISSLLRPRAAASSGSRSHSRPAATVRADLMARRALQGRHPLSQSVAGIRESCDGSLIFFPVVLVCAVKASHISFRCRSCSLCRLGTVLMPR